MFWLALLFACGDDRIDDHEQRVLALEARMLQAEQDNARLKARVAELEQPVIRPVAPEVGTHRRLEVTRVAPDRFRLRHVEGQAENPEDGGRALLHHGADGRVDGYQLVDMGPGALPARLGLRNGDVVRALNGRPLTSVGAAREAWRTAGPQFTLSLRRDGHELRLRYEID